MLKSFSLFGVTDREAVTTVDRVANSFTIKVLPILPSQLFHAKFRVSSVTPKNPASAFQPNNARGGSIFTTMKWNPTVFTAKYESKNKTKQTNKQNKKAKTKDDTPGGETPSWQLWNEIQQSSYPSMKTKNKRNKTKQQQKTMDYMSGGETPSWQ